MADEQPIDPDEQDGQEPVYFPSVDPNGLQATGTVAAAAGLVLATSGSGLAEAGMASGVTHLLATALAGTGAGVPAALTLGLALVALGVVLNFASLALRHRAGKSETPAAACDEAEV